jgi:fatty aldehyde-generating acyl-ACP reductase
MIAPAPAKFAAVGHPIDMALFREYMHFLKPEKQFSDRLALKFFEWTPAYKIGEVKDVGVDGVGKCNGIIVMVPFLPEMKDIRLAEVTRKIEQAIEIAAQHGCMVAALGGFTSIVLQGQEKTLAEKYGIRLTSGNSFTAAVIVRSIEILAQRRGVDLARSRVMIVGASGDIGSACAGYFCDKAGTVVMVARGLDRLRETVQRFSSFSTCTFELVTESQMSESIRDIDIAIFSTSAYSEIIDQDVFASGTIVCDASAPLNVRVHEPLRNDILIYHGGVVEMPFDIDPGLDIGLPSPRYFYGCQIEGMLIAMNPQLPDSWGRGNITRDKLEQYLQVLDTFPFLTPAFTCGKQVLRG